MLQQRRCNRKVIFCNFTFMILGMIKTRQCQTFLKGAQGQTRGNRYRLQQGKFQLDNPEPQVLCTPPVIRGFS